MGKYDGMKLAELKEELRKRNARVSGRKQELIERLESYDRNNNFSQQPDTTAEVFKMDLPDGSSYRDVTANTTLPPISNEAAVLYLQQFSASLDKTCKQLYKDRFLRFVRFSKVDNSYVFIKSECRAQMYTRKIYEIDLKLDQYGNTIQAQCECAAGAGPQGHCKHIRTLLHALTDHTNLGSMKLELACTEQVQSFHRPKKMHKGSPVKASSLQLGRVKSDFLIFNPIDPKFAEDDSVTTARARNSTIALAANYGLKNALLQDTLPANIYGVNTDHDYLFQTAAEQRMKREGLVTISDKEITEIECQTRDQASSSAWFDERCKRLTASNFGKLCKLTDQADKAKLARGLMSKKSISSHALMHGRRYESVALIEYEHDFGTTVDKVGFVVDKQRPYLGCSPDGFVGDDLLIEVKCPYSSKDKDITPLSVPYLYEDNGTLSLKRSHDYMYQIQGQMHITGRKTCHLVIYTLQDMKVVIVHYDDLFVTEMLTKLDDFFDNVFKVEYLKKHFYRGTHLLHASD